MALRNRWFFTPFALFVTIAILCSIRKRALEAEQARPYGNFTTRQILNRSLPLCRMVCPLANRLRLTAERYPMYTAHGHRQRIWDVRYIDEEGRQTGEIKWDATTGNLLYISHFHPRFAVGGSLVADRTRAIEAARTWMRALSPAHNDSQWRLAQTPQCYHKRWAITLRSADRCAVTRIDATSGSLIDMRSLSTEL
jgi:hypothetical protein